MEFDRSKIFTTVNAEELKTGSKVIVADNITRLKEKVTEYYAGNKGCINVITKITPEDHSSRFGVCEEDVDIYWELAYLISEPNTLKCAELKIGDVVTNGVVDLMVLGLDRRFDPEILVYLPGREWCNDDDLIDFYKKGQKDE